MERSLPMRAKMGMVGGIAFQKLYKKCCIDTLYCPR